MSKKRENKTAYSLPSMKGALGLYTLHNGEGSKEIFLTEQERDLPPEIRKLILSIRKDQSN